MLLTVVTFLPALGALLVFFLPRGRPDLVKATGFGVAAATFLASVPLYLRFDGADASYQFVEYRPWIPSLGIGYHLRIDGISLLLVLLTTFLMPLTLLSAWHAIESRWKEFAITMLLLETGMVGVFVALDLFLFYVFWEAMLVPMYLIIGIWGGSNRVYAAIKFILYTLTGSLLMLVAILALYFRYGAATGTYTFDLPVLAQFVLPGGRAQDLLFLAFALAFAIKVPMFPFHTWLPDAHVEAPTAGSVILAGVLLKMGTYGFLRLALPLFPIAAARFAPLIAILAVIGILYGGLVSLVQPNLKKLVAYSSVAHLGFVMLGVAAMTTTAVVGAVYQMLNHGISTGALFLLVGMLYDRRHTFLIEEFGGLKAVMPWFSAVFLLICFSSIAVPGFNGFVGEFLIMVGSWRAPYLSGPVLVALASAGVVIAAAYILWMVQRVLYGDVTRPANAGLRDLSAREALVLTPLVVLALFMGIASPMFTRTIEPAADALVRQVRPAR